MWSLPSEFQTAYYYGVEGGGGDAIVQLIKVEDGRIGGILFFSGSFFWFLCFPSSVFQDGNAKIKSIF